MIFFGFVAFDGGQKRSFAHPTQLLSLNSY
jgi:hypothetical protein